MLLSLLKLLYSKIGSRLNSLFLCALFPFITLIPAFCKVKIHFYIQFSVNGRGKMASEIKNVQYHCSNKD